MYQTEERVTEERDELEFKLRNLHAFMETRDFRTLKTAEKDRLKQQARVMRAYSKILADRIIDFKLGARQLAAV